MNAVFFSLVAVAFVVAGYRQLTAPSVAGRAGPMDALGGAMIEAAGGAVTLAIGLIGVMTLFLGLMKVAEAGGLLVMIARVVRPLMQRLFPEVPPTHPAMGAIILNISANALGLGNAATPFGIRAMQALETLNPTPGTASNAQVLFLAINTSSITLLPTGVIALRAAAGSAEPAAIVPTTLFATICSTSVAIVMAKLLQRRWPGTADGRADGAVSTAAPDAAATVAPRASSSSAMDSPASPPEAAADGTGAGEPVAGTERGYAIWVSMLVLIAVLGLIPLTLLYGRQISPWIIPGLMVGLLGFGMMRRVRVYEVFVDGAREGFQVAVRIIPYLVAILVAVAMFRESGALAAVIEPLSTLTRPLGLPAEALPMALLRPLSGSGAFGVLASIINDPAIGPDSYTGLLVSTIQGSTETTFYVIAVYFGAVGVRRLRHALPAALCADAAGIAAAAFICATLFA